MIGFITDDVATTPFAGQIIQGAQDEAFKNGNTLLIINTNNNSKIEADAFRLMNEYQVQGIIYSTWYHHEVEVNKPSLPMVLVNCFESDMSYTAIVPDENIGGESATDILIKNGHKRIAFLNTTSLSPAKTERLKGYQEALIHAGITYDPSLVINVEPNQTGGYNATRKVLEMNVTGVFCHNDRVAMGLYDGLKELGIKIPNEISIIGFDNQEIISDHLHPRLTTMQLPHYQLGVMGIKKLIEQVNHDKNDIDLFKIDCPAVMRDSVFNVNKE